MSLATNVVRRGAVYYFRIRVPVHLRSLVGRHELWRSLQTVDPTVARRRCRQMIALTETLWGSLQSGMSPDQIKTLINGWLKVQLDADEDARITHDQGLIATLEQAHHDAFGDALWRKSTNDTSVAVRHVSELVVSHGLVLSAKEEAIAVQIMVGAHYDLFRALAGRRHKRWRPHLDTDPAQPLLDRLEQPLPDRVSANNGSRPDNILQNGKQIAAAATTISLATAADEAIPEIARMEEIKPGRVKDYRIAVRTFIDWMGRDLDLTEITSEVAGRFKYDLTYYPSNVNKRLPYRDLATFQERLSSAKAAGDQQVLSAVTINGKYLTPLRRVFEWQKGNGRRLDNPFSGIHAAKPKHADPAKIRRDFSRTEVRALFASPLFTGASAAAGHGLYRPGQIRVSDWRFWVPLICMFSGMRLNEACGLALVDFRVEDGIDYFHVRDEVEGQSLKSVAARRKVPIHSALITTGIIDHVKKVRATGAARLFDELKLDSRGYYSSKPSRFYPHVIKRIVDAAPDDPGVLTFHCSRHTVISRLRAAEVRLDVSKEIVGHDQDEVHGGYGSFDVKTLKVAVDKIAYDGLDLERCRTTVS